MHSLNNPLTVLSAQEEIQTATNANVQPPTPSTWLKRPQ